MIIESLKLEPFGHIRSARYNFTKNLNVVLGPNEAGKSTIFSAIQKVLFVPSRLTKSQLKRIMDFIPIGGDTASVEIAFVCGGRRYVLKRSWGSIPQASLSMPDGTVLQGEDNIKSVLNDILPVGEGTFKAVLMAYQTGLIRTIEELKNEYRDTIHTLGDILRRAVLETDGISVEKFKERIQSLYNKYFDHWDVDNDYPSKGRGINNPWKQEVGIILKAFYDTERVRLQLEEARAYEEDMDKINMEIEKYKNIKKELEVFIDSNKHIIEDLRKREAIEARISLLDREIKELTDIAQKWPVAEDRLNMLKDEIPELEEKVRYYEHEKRLAEREREKEYILDHFRRVKEKKEAYERLQAEIRSMRRITHEDAKNLQEIEKHLQILRTKISSTNFSVRISPKNNVDIKIGKNMEGKEKISLKPKEDMVIEGYFIELEHRDLDIEISSKGENIKDLIQQAKSLEKDFYKLLTGYGVQSVDEVVQSARVYESKLKELNMLKKAFHEELGGKTFDELEQMVKDTYKEKANLSLDEALRKYIESENRLKEKQKEKKELESLIKSFEERFGSKEKLLVIIGEKISLKKEEEKVLSSLTPLPEDIDGRRLQEEYERKEKELEEIRERLRVLELEKARREEGAPEMSGEELERMLEEAREKFRRAKRKGFAIKRIKDLTERLLERIDRDNHKGLKQELEGYVSFITGNRYERVELDQNLPEGFIRPDGKLLPYRLLSAGTKDTLALALRLTMANYFLKDSDGFIAMDDPLVNLDPQRQERAVKLLQDYARNKQVIIFTCHPAHAELFDGHLIQI